MRFLELPTIVTENQKSEIRYIQIMLQRMGILTQSDFQYGEINSIVKTAIKEFKSTHAGINNDLLDSDFTSAFNAHIKETAMEELPDLQPIVERLQTIDNWLTGGGTPEQQIEQFGDVLVSTSEQAMESLKDAAFDEGKDLKTALIGGS